MKTSNRLTALLSASEQCLQAACASASVFITADRTLEEARQSTARWQERQPLGPLDGEPGLPPTGQRLMPRHGDDDRLLRIALRVEQILSPSTVPIDRSA